jgi:NitT/TauT family transport system ATP-binding protein
MTTLRLIDAAISRGGRTLVAAAQLSLHRGEIVGLLGPSGAGKTSLLRVCAGMEPLARGQREAIGRIGAAFQEPRLLPWSNARDNVAFVFGEADGGTRAERMLQALGIDGADARKYPRQLSGGMRQRVSLARLLAFAPDIMLLDEPFSGLDPANRRTLSALLADRADAGAAILFATHDLIEAAALADRVCVIDPVRARLIDGPPIGTPRRVRSESDAQTIAFDLLACAAAGAGLGNPDPMQN